MGKIRYEYEVGTACTDADGYTSHVTGGLFITHKASLAEYKSIISAPHNCDGVYCEAFWERWIIDSDGNGVIDERFSPR